MLLKLFLFLFFFFKSTLKIHIRTPYSTLKAIQATLWTNCLSLFV